MKLKFLLPEQLQSVAHPSKGTQGAHSTTAFSVHIQSPCATAPAQAATAILFDVEDVLQQSEVDISLGCAYVRKSNVQDVYINIGCIYKSRDFVSTSRTSFKVPGYEAVAVHRSA